MLAPMPAIPAQPSVIDLGPPAASLAADDELNALYQKIATDAQLWRRYLNSARMPGALHLRRPPPLQAMEMRTPGWLGWRC
jgi:hypothetical protein